MNTGDICARGVTLMDNKVALGDAFILLVRGQAVQNVVLARIVRNTELAQSGVQWQILMMGMIFFRWTMLPQVY